MSGMPVRWMRVLQLPTGLTTPGMSPWPCSISTPLSSIFIWKSARLSMMKCSAGQAAGMWAWVVNVFRVGKDTYINRRSFGWKSLSQNMTGQKSLREGLNVGKFCKWHLLSNGSKSVNATISPQVWAAVEAAPAPGLWPNKWVQGNFLRLVQISILLHLQMLQFSQTIERGKMLS